MFSNALKYVFCSRSLTSYGAHNYFIPKCFPAKFNEIVWHLFAGLCAGLEIIVRPFNLKWCNRKHLMSYEVLSNDVTLKHCTTEPEILSVYIIKNIFICQQKSRWMIKGWLVDSFSIVVPMHVLQVTANFVLSRCIVVRMYQIYYIIILYITVILLCRISY